VSLAHALFLALAIVAEVIGTTALKASDGFTRLWPSLVTAIGYAASFYCMSLVVRAVPVGIVYAIWSGVGIVLISSIGWALYGEKLDWAALLGMALIVAGVLVLNLLSGSVRH
jgi:small multidrug resistance pump